MRDPGNKMNRKCPSQVRNSFHVPIGAIVDILKCAEICSFNLFILRSNPRNDVNAELQGFRF